MLERIIGAIAGKQEDEDAEIAVEPCEECANKDQTVTTAKRIAQENFDLVVSCIAQRDEWKEMYMRISRQAATAQQMLQSMIDTREKQLLSVIKEVNAYRKKLGIREVSEPTDLIAPPAAPVEEFQRLVELLDSKAPEDIDWREKRTPVIPDALDLSGS